MRQRLTGAAIAVATLFIGLNIWTLATVGNTERQSDIRAEITGTGIVSERKVTVAQKTAPPKPAQRRVVTYKTQTPAKLTDRELECLARNIYFEAGVENRAGKLAVAQVTINRRNEGRWGNDVCKVVYSKAQFRWTLSKQLRNAKPKGELWQESLAVAREFKSGVRIKNLEDTQFYHADYISQPQWAKTMQVSHKIGQHIFYQKI